MTSAIINNCWKNICCKPVEKLITVYQPLFNINKYVTHFNLLPLQSLNTTFNAAPPLPSIQPSFKNLTNDIILNLRHDIYTNTKSDTCNLWAECLLRFCEIQYRHLKSKCLQKCQNIESARILLLHLTSFFIDYSIDKNDLRFLNIVLKLSDLKWLINKTVLAKSINSESPKLTKFLFQFRILLLTEFSINQLTSNKLK